MQMSYTNVRWSCRTVMPKPSKMKSGSQASRGGLDSFEKLSLSQPSAHTDRAARAPSQDTTTTAPAFDVESPPALPFAGRRLVGDMHRPRSSVDRSVRPPLIGPRHVVDIRGSGGASVWGICMRGFRWGMTVGPCMQAGYESHPPAGTRMRLFMSAFMDHVRTWMRPSRSDPAALGPWLDLTVIF